jgi:hypothetical protein
MKHIVATQMWKAVRSGGTWSGVQVAFQAKYCVYNTILLWACIFYHRCYADDIRSCQEEEEWPPQPGARPGAPPVDHPSLLITLLLHKEKESGLIHVDVSLGNPAVSQRLVVDTGSRWTAVQCYTSQRRRRKGSSHYDPLKSSTSRKVVTDTTRVKERYEDGSYWSGYEVYDDLMLTDSTMGMSFRVHNMPLACQTNASPEFRDDATVTGILGLEYNPAMSSLPALLRAQGAIRDNTISICVGQRQGLLTSIDTKSP